MIEPDSKPVDLVFDELLRQLTSMESSNVQVARLKAISIAIESLIDMMGTRYSFSQAAKNIANRLDDDIYLSVVLEGLERSIPLSEANHFISIESCDCPNIRYVNQAHGMLLKARDRIVYDDLIRKSDDSDVTAIMRQSMEFSFSRGGGLESVIGDLCTASRSIDYRLGVYGAINSSLPFKFHSQLNWLGNRYSSLLVLKNAARVLQSDTSYLDRQKIA